MTEITLNGEVYVKKDEIKIDSEILIKTMKELEPYQLLDIVGEVADCLIKEKCNYEDLEGLVIGGNASGTNRAMLMLQWATKVYL